jgi:hypothetical protein
MRKFFSIWGIGTLLILPALCNAIECSLQIEPAASPHDCCPRGGHPASHKNDAPKSNASTCPYFFLDKVKKAAVYAGVAPLAARSPLPPPALLAQTTAPIARLADRSQTYLFNRVFLL